MIAHLAKSEPLHEPPMPMRTIDELAAWRGRDFTRADDFTHRLTGAEISEIDAACRPLRTAASITPRSIAITSSFRSSACC